MLIKFVRNAFRAPIGRAISSNAAMYKQQQQLDAMQLSVMDAENCILLDCDDKAIGRASKKDCHLVKQDGSLLLHRAFSVYLFNTKNELLLQKRSAHKITYPNCFTNSCCSHPLWDIPGERVEENAMGIRRAAQRRLELELGISSKLVRPEDFHYIARFHYKDKGDGVWGEHEVTYILFLKGDYKLSPNEDEIDDVRYVSLDDFDSFLRNLNGPVTPWLKLLSKSHIKYWWANLHRLETIADEKSIYRFQESLN